MSYHRCALAPQIEKTFWCEEKGGPCDGNGFRVGEDALETIDKCEVCQKSSMYGNYYLVLTEEDIQTLKSGKVLAVLENEYNIQEYNIFVMMGE